MRGFGERPASSPNVRDGPLQRNVAQNAVLNRHRLCAGELGVCPDNMSSNRKATRCSRQCSWNLLEPPKSDYVEAGRSHLRPTHVV